MVEQLITSPTVAVAEAEYRRLLGYPRDHSPGERSLELAAAARLWFEQHGQPWIYWRETKLHFERDRLNFDGHLFPSPQLGRHLRAVGAERAVVIAVSAGRACEERARQLWLESKPDEYFFLETFGSAVVEQLVAMVNGRLCADAEIAGFSAVPHYSPGYDDWDVAEQNLLFELLRRGCARDFPEPLEVLSSGMLRPKKSLLGIIGLAPRATTTLPGTSTTVPCRRCSFSPCQYRRAPYRHQQRGVEPAANGSRVSPVIHGNGASAPVPLTRNAAYSVNARALQKWAEERVHLEPAAGETLIARFRFDGTTCSNMGRPLAFDYHVVLGPPASGFRVLRAECRPCDGDEGHRSMCEYLRDPQGLMAEISAAPPMVGRPLDDVLRWKRPSAPSGCYCDTDSRAHKWGLALEVIHYALLTRPPGRSLVNVSPAFEQLPPHG